MPWSMKGRDESLAEWTIWPSDVGGWHARITSYDGRSFEVEHAGEYVTTVKVNGLFDDGSFDVEMNPTPAIPGRLLTYRTTWRGVPAESIAQAVGAMLSGRVGLPCENGGVGPHVGSPFKKVSIADPSGGGTLIVYVETCTTEVYGAAGVVFALIDGKWHRADSWTDLGHGLPKKGDIQGRFGVPPDFYEPLPLLG